MFRFLWVLTSVNGGKKTGCSNEVILIFIFFFNLLFVFQRRLCDEEDFIKKKFIEGTRI
jgi:hypothetical protein